jgi:hypothetical protein
MAAEQGESMTSILFKLPPFGKFVDALIEAGIQTKTARGFWGGVNPDGDIILTAWIDFNDGDGRFYVWRPPTNHGGLKEQWQVGNIRVGTNVRLILVRPRKEVPMGEKRQVAGAALLPAKWRVAKMTPDKPYQAIVELAA